MKRNKREALASPVSLHCLNAQAGGRSAPSPCSEEMWVSSSSGYRAGTQLWGAGLWDSNPNPPPGRLPRHGSAPLSIASCQLCLLNVPLLSSEHSLLQILLLPRRNNFKFLSTKALIAFQPHGSQKTPKAGTYTHVLPSIATSFSTEQ